jgi:hypothetical protein
MNDRLDAVLKKLLPYRMAEDLSAHGDDAEFVAAQIEEYVKANDLSKKEMAAFHDSDGLDVIKDSINQHGIPNEDREESGDSRFELN